MKRNDWAGGFWAKAAAFFLAVVLVPVLLSYGAALAFSYSGELRGDFYESSICSSAVYREMSHVYDSYHYYVENGQSGVLEKYDDWYPADDRSTNVRFSIEDEAGTILFDNHRTGDVPVTGWWGEMAQDGVVFRSYIAVDYPAQDSIYRARDFYYTMKRLAPHAAAVVLACAAAELFFLVFLARAAGRRPGREEAVAGWQEKLPFDLYVLLLLGGGGVLVVAAVESAESRVDRYDPIVLALLLAFAALAYALFLAFWMTLCTRVKLGRWWENTVCCWLLRLCRRILRWCWRVLCRAWGALADFVRGIPLVWRTAVGCCVIGVLLIAFESNHAAGPLLLTLLVLSVAACLFSMQLRRLQKGGEALAAGDLTSKVDTSRMYFDLKRHGENLNAISRGMSIAVEQRLKSERLKTELITNVSHDIKTPLTSIVNYVDLLQREHTPEQEREYLAVLDRQAHKLKKLTVDLVEIVQGVDGQHSLPHRAAERARAGRPDGGRVRRKAVRCAARAGGDAAGRGALLPVRRRADVARAGQSPLERLQVCLRGHAALHRGEARGRDGGVLVQEHLARCAQHRPRRADGALCARGQLAHDRGQRAWAEHRQEPCGAAEGHVLHRHRRRPVQGRLRPAAHGVTISTQSLKKGLKKIKAQNKRPPAMLGSSQERGGLFLCLICGS